jgi:cell division septation protein DedD
MRRRQEDSIDSAAVRNLDEIREADPGARPSRVGALVLASLGGACIVFAAVLLLRSPPKERPVNADPLGDLVAKAHPAGAAPSPREQALGRDVTFPSILSDSKSPTTALEAVRTPRPVDTAAAQVPPGALGTPGAVPAALAGDPGSLSMLAADRLPPMPLPAQHVLQILPSETTPRDTLSSMARKVSRDDGAESPPGAPGGYQLQVSSFKTQEEANKFAAALRRRGHRAYIEPANVKGRGLWYRVRIGPFKYRHSAVIYRQEFEAKERLVTFIVDPPKTTVRVRSADDDASDE